MRKTMTKIFALVLVCAMIIGFVAMIPAQAAELDTVQVMAHNVYFDDYLQIMYAVYVPEGKTVEKIVLSDDVNEFAAVPYVEDDAQVTVSVGGKSCLAYVADTGVTLQNIDTVVTAEVYVGGDVVATDEYSVLEYLHKQLTVENKSADQDAMYLSLLDAAEAMQKVLNGGVTLYSTSYVNVTNGTVDGLKSEGMVAVDATLENVTCDLNPGANQEVVWTVTEYTKGVPGAPVEKTTAAVQAMVVEEGVNLVLEASLKDTSVDEPDVIANGNFVIAVNHNDTYYAMDAALNDKNRINNVAVNVFNGAVTTDSAPQWTVTNVTGGVTLHNGTQYLTHTGGTNATFALVDEFDANTCVWTVEVGEHDEIYLNSIKTPERGILFNANSNLNQFGVYATSNGSNSSYARAMLFMVYEPCEHTGTLVNNVAATCGEAGYSGDTVCSICGALMAPGEILEATGEHNFVEGTCTVCGESEGTASGPVTVSVTMADQGWSNGVKYTTLELDGNITASVTGGTNTGKYYTSDSTWRIYQNEDPTLTISAATGTIKSVKITYLTSNSGTLMLNSSNVKSNDVVEVNAASITFNVGNTGSGTKGQVKVTAIEVVYETGASAASLSNYATAPYDWRKWF